MAILDIRERWLALRDRLLADPAFHRFAVAFPLTRPIAKRRARALFDLVSGFVYSQVLLACVRLDVFEALRSGPATAAEHSARIGLAPEPCRRLLDAAAALGLAEHRTGGRYGLGVHGAALLAKPAVLRMIEHHGDFYADLEDPVALLSGTGEPPRLARLWAYAITADGSKLSDADVRAYTSLMSSTQALVNEEILGAYRFGQHATVMDVGGGDGTFLRAVAAQAPGTRLMLFDLPAVASRAQAAFAAAGLSQRVTIHGGDFRRDQLPRGADIATLVRVIHDHDDETVEKILSSIYRALPENGTLLIAEPMARTPGAEVVGDVYFNFYFMAMRSGRARSFDDISRMMKAAGFNRISRLMTRLPLQTSMAIGRKPGPTV